MNSELERLRRNFKWEVPPSPDPKLSNWYSPEKFAPIESAFLDSVIETRAKRDSQSWWYVARNAIIEEALETLKYSEVIWDVGSGTGFVASALQKRGWSIVAIEPSREGSRLAARAGLSAFHSTLAALNLPNESLGAVSLFDVLEHVENRNELLAEIMRVLKPGGFLFVTVPALPALWSRFDENEGHRLRYTKLTLKNELTTHNFTCERIGYFFSLPLIPLVFSRVLPYRMNLRWAVEQERGMISLPRAIGCFFTLVEKSLALHTPVGSSLLAIARKV